MRGKSQTCTVKDGRIRISCPRCEKRRYIAVPAGLRKKSVRCDCGMTTNYTLNHRVLPRESTCGKALVIVQGGREIPVYLCDISLGGIAFNVPHQYVRSIANVQELTIKFRSITGSTVSRKILIKSTNNNRVGAQFLDAWIPSF